MLPQLRSLGPGGGRYPGFALVPFLVNGRGELCARCSALAARATDDMQIYSDRLNNMSESNGNYESN